MVKIICSLEEAIKTVENLKFNPTDEIFLEETHLVLSDWEIKIERFNVVLKEGFIIDREYDPFQYSKNLTVLICGDECIFSNRSYMALLEKYLKISSDEVKKMKCEFKR